MKAAVLPNYGSTELFVIKETKSPALKDGQILVKNRASSVNPIDEIMRSGKTKLMTGMFGDQIVGADFSGTVVYSRSELFKAGDEVFGFMGALTGGAYADEVVVNADNACLKPAVLSFTEAAALGLAGTTAWQGLIKEGSLRSRKDILINGCTGGVGCIAVQIAKSLGIHITGRCNPRNFEFAKQLGCDQVVSYEEQLSPVVKYDLIFDAAGKLTLTDISENLTETGVFVATKGNLDSVTGVFNTAKDLLFKNNMKLVKVSPDEVALNGLKELVEAGQLKSYLAATFPLEQAGEAHRMLEKGGFVGKIAISID
ncbi:MAG: NAD(P)-dependent alcohol dehydrogenase [Chitinophagaceae bacterium]|nr:MAG: NAD(P)-dependent alcohol dehydrogenase [Chitinophagaceae bacterium]